MEKILTKVLIIQNLIPAYRIPFFEDLSRVYDVTVLFYAGNAPKLNTENLRFIKSTRIKHIKSFHLTSGVLEIAQTNDIVVIMFDIWWLNLALLPFLLKKSKVKTILWGHGIGRTNGFKIATYLRKKIAQNADALIFYTLQAKEYFVEKTRISNEKCFVANNTIAVPNHGMSHAEKSYFLYLGRIQERKKLGELLSAYALLSNDIKSRYSILLVGDGASAEVNKLKIQTAELKIEGNVSFFPATYLNEEIKDYYSAAIASVSPGAVGLGIIHSFAFGVPLITNKNMLHGPEFDNSNDQNSYLYNGTVERSEDRVFELRDQLKKVVENPLLLKQKSEMAYNTFLLKCSMTQMTQGFINAINYSLKTDQLS